MFGGLSSRSLGTRWRIEEHKCAVTEEHHLGERKRVNHAQRGQRSLYEIEIRQSDEKIRK
jgi:hypothetical protein